MSDLLPYSAPALSRRQHNRVLELVRQEADRRATRIGAKTYVADTAMQAVTVVGMMEEACIKRAPLAESRLDLIAQGHSISVADEVMRPW
jgi:hypothetical protein